jgi:hypothetical protein
MICCFCNHNKKDRQQTHSRRPLAPYCWECGKEWPEKMVARHAFIDNLTYIEQEAKRKGLL